MDGKFELQITSVPEVIYMIRHEMAELLRREADGEPPIVRKKLLRLAAEFEVGATGS